MYILASDLVSRVNKYIFKVQNLCGVEEIFKYVFIDFAVPIYWESLMQIVRTGIWYRITI